MKPGMKPGNVKPGIAMTSDAERRLSLYSGRDPLGMVIERAGGVDAFDGNGVHLGTFRTIKAASDAVSLSRFDSSASPVSEASETECVPDGNGHKETSS
jgi:hypothetical protein